MITARNNAGKQAGIDISDLLSGYELQMLVNRSTIFRAAQNAPQGFRLGVYDTIGALSEANEKAGLEAFAEATRTIRAEFNKTGREAVEETDKKINGLIRQGYEKPKGKTYTPDNTLIYIIAATLANVYMAIMQSAATVQQQTLSIANTVTGTADEQAAQISRALKQAAQTGATVMTAQGNSELAAYGEGIVTNSGLTAYRQVQSEAQTAAGINLVQISAHPSSCPLCTPWQTKILINDEFGGAVSDGKHELLSVAIAAGLFHYNCRHEMTPFVVGISDPRLYDKDKASVKETAARYAIEQEQRYNERSIREWRRVYESAITPQEEVLAKMKVSEWQARQRTLAEIAKEQDIPFYRQYHREQLTGKTTPDETISRIAARWAA